MKLISYNFTVTFGGQWYDGFGRLNTQRHVIVMRKFYVFIMRTFMYYRYGSACFIVKSFIIHKLFIPANKVTNRIQ